MHQKEKKQEISSSFEEICDLINNLNTEKDDAIVLSRKLSVINELFRRTVMTESSLRYTYAKMLTKILS